MIKDIQQLQNSCAGCHLPQPMKDQLCYICATQHMFSGKWKLLILWSLRQSPQRFSQLLRAIPNVKQGPLTAQLKELADCGLILRTSFNEVPPRVEYSLTEKGKSFLAVLEGMDSWARENLFPM